MVDKNYIVVIWCFWDMEFLNATSQGKAAVLFLGTNPKAAEVYASNGGQAAAGKGKEYVAYNLQYEQKVVGQESIAK